MKYSSINSQCKQSIKLALLSLVLIQNIGAKESEIKHFVKGSFQQIQQERQDKPYIITFWSETCAFCMKELSMFGKLLKTYPNVEIVSITTDAFLEAKTINKILSSKELGHVQKWVFADNFVERLHFDIDKRWRGELPLTYFFDKNNKMLKHLGVVKEDELTEWFAKQQ